MQYIVNLIYDIVCINMSYIHVTYIYRVAVAMTAGSNFRTAATGLYSSVS